MSAAACWSRFELQPVPTIVAQAPIRPLSRLCLLDGESARGPRSALVTPSLLFSSTVDWCFLLHFFFIQIVFLYHGFGEFLAVCLSPLGLKG